MKNEYGILHVSPRRVIVFTVNGHTTTSVGGDMQNRVTFGNGEAVTGFVTYEQALQFISDQNEGRLSK